MKKIQFFILIGLLFFSLESWGKVDVVTTTTTLKSIVQLIGGDRVSVISITKGSQDPHYVEAKPSYMVKLRNADLLVLVGLDLEIGWVDNIIRGSRNPRIAPGRQGYFNAGSVIQPIEVPDGRVDRSLGDIHSGGNPHYYLDPVRMIEVGKALSERLKKIDPDGKEVFDLNYQKYQEEIRKKLDHWKSRVLRSKVKEVITYHRTVNYFLDRFGIKFVDAIEFKPGVPPTAKHILHLIDVVNSKKIPCILVESFFELKAATRIQKDTQVKVFRVPTEVEALPGVDSFFGLIETLVQSVEKCGVAHE